MSTGLAAFVVGVIMMGVAGVGLWSTRDRPSVAKATGNEFLPSPSPSFPAYPSAADWAPLATMRDELDADSPVESMADHGGGPAVPDGPGDPVPAHGPSTPAALRIELSELDVDSFADLDLDRSGPEVIIDLTGSAPALELAARLRLPMGSGAVDLPAPRSVDPVVQALIDRFRESQALAGRGPQAATRSQVTQ